MSGATFEIIELLRRIEAQSRPMTPAELKEKSPEDFEKARLLKIKQTSLADVYAHLAHLEGFGDDVSSYAEFAARRARALKKEKAKGVTIPFSEMTTKRG